ncbi:hypothetical protein Sjap_000744 [Stephania japonica]|uniref:Uncharacterized protein n=1 Tax=Stephania japonica TaxID=461633 RepID=A0AAP0PSU4_9MAGN
MDHFQTNYEQLPQTIHGAKITNRSTVEFMNFDRLGVEFSRKITYRKLKNNIIWLPKLSLNLY